MRYTLRARGHPNVSARHRTTLEVTVDPQIGKTADCIIGVSSSDSVSTIPEEIKRAIRDPSARIRLVLRTENGFDEVRGYGHPDLTLDHPTDIVCRRSSYICGRTLMIGADKAACDLSEELVRDLMEGKELTVEIIVE
ncbi:DUF371 domain-containing protein [Methanothermobacter wolfeii]|uniref:DUF371 domain-containing protein n=1 Tax=Methanothermobacter wolfeii TaxID=145261 RepID=A0A9E7RRC6_METWO|nr:MULTISPECIES: DUF371 domain-containing protein [Methanothermobacter]MDI6701419.1 DUF371 domain-containing protein [Methanothermobacter wolfeii]MDI6842078.1 DUF371 domain-containing protein [Methanothermobacter wolfeii]NLM03314.1 DUF371 domain-containing protein [Methanothermobacter wolfeii]QHN06442.1 DUF371 domain-containing protein [Methanothermobacter sp. THM-1]UXH30941.1 DUF371 domain-containing protein [Methanothermobacter wolfeii]